MRCHKLATPSSAFAIVHGDQPLFLHAQGQDKFVVEVVVTLTHAIDIVIVMIPGILSGPSFRKG